METSNHNATPLSILIVDDDDLDRELIRRSLQEAFSTHTIIDETATGLRGLENLKNTHYDCLILDNNLPDGKSEEFIKLIQDLKIKVPIIVTTGLGSEDLVASVMRQGALDYIAKNAISAKSLSRSVHNAIKIHASHMEQERLKEELIRSNDELMKFAETVAHDLKSPLTTILTFISYMQTQYKEPDTVRIIERVNNTAQNMNHLISDLLDYAALQNESKSKEAINLSDLLKEISEDCESLIKQTKGQVEIDKLPTLFGTRIRIKQLFQNLIGNGLKFHLPDRPPIVKIYCTQNNDQHIQLVVEDNGIGFDQKNANSIFEPLKRLIKTPAYPGTGIGLAICKRIVGELKGKIRAESKEGSGTKFFLDFDL